MTTKDYVYLGLLALSAVVFYWTGFYGGFNTTLKMLESKEDGNSTQDFEPKSVGLDTISAASLSLPTVHAKSQRQTVPVGANKVHFPISESNFGRN